MFRRLVWDVEFLSGEVLPVFASEPEIVQVAADKAKDFGTSVKTIQQRELLAFYAECIIRWFMRQPRVVSASRKEEP